MTPGPYRLTLPDRRTTSVVFASPHSGSYYPKEFLGRSVLGEKAIRSSEDAFVDRLLDPVPGFGAPLLTAVAPRAFVDLNRAADELDPALIEGFRAPAHNPRVASGLGVVPRVVSGGRAIYAGKLPLHEVKARISDWWHPYHDRLQILMDESRLRFGQAILIDMHSMPHEALDAVTVPGRLRPEVVLGDRYGTSASAAIMEAVDAAFARAGLRTVRNMPFAGAYIAQAYGRPARAQHVVQIEIDRSLYMNEAEVRPNGNFTGFQRILSGVLSEIAMIGRAEDRLAAE
ncbi:N-formylglutamate amidohydrolase [Albidovulum sediminicola]|uniref:N-formylglutamate amidohydrolase n=1 Tax=Albidovulum sediminicola TaxID=2984331 RepID=A0ABT2YYV0_9RHOB|nr:N-formylglutamate amidohydrolase [Defluviimonas sp. WL0075]MCV2863965.1 N-formylglutamate amidohydrolase [Defluviimonas sp. WL0075]